MSLCLTSSTGCGMIHQVAEFNVGMLGLNLGGIDHCQVLHPGHWTGRWTECCSDELPASNSGVCNGLIWLSAFTAMLGRPRPPAVGHILEPSDHILTCHLGPSVCRLGRWRIQRPSAATPFSPSLLHLTSFLSLPRAQTHYL